MCIKFHANLFLAIVIFTGIETRMALNSREGRSKFGKLDRELNKISKLCFLFLSISALIMFLMKGGVSDIE